MNKREWLRSQGFNVGERGRLTPAMIAALEDYDGDDNPIQEKPKKMATVLYVEPMFAQVRNSKVLTGWDREGKKVTFVTCYNCKEHMMYCHCKSGIFAPPSVIKTNDKEVYVKA